MFYLKKKIKKFLIRNGYHSQPDFIILGAQKSGTTYLYSMLKNHPDIQEPGWKEIHYFDNSENFKKGKNWYFYHFYLPYRFKKNQITFEATPDYLASPLAPRRIKSLLPEIKMIVILRDPIMRALSGWNMHHFLFKDHPKYNFLYDPREFGEAIRDEIKNGDKFNDGRNYLYYGKYAEHLKNYFKEFARSQILILDNNDLMENEEEFMSQIHEFLLISDHKYERSIKTFNTFWENKSNYKQDMEWEEKHLLNEYYTPYNKELVKLLSRKFSWIA